MHQQAQSVAKPTAQAAWADKELAEDPLFDAGRQPSIDHVLDIQAILGRSTVRGSNVDPQNTNAAFACPKRPATVWSGCSRCAVGDSTVAGEPNELDVTLAKQRTKYRVAAQAHWAGANHRSGAVAPRGWWPGATQPTRFGTARQVQFRQAHGLRQEGDRSHSWLRHAGKPDRKGSAGLTERWAMSAKRNRPVLRACIPFECRNLSARTRFNSTFPEGNRACA